MYEALGGVGEVWVRFGKVWRGFGGGLYIRGGLGPYGPGAMIVLQELVLICKAVTPELWVAEFGLQCTNMFSTIVVINMWSSDSRVLGASLQPSLLQEALLN